MTANNPRPRLALMFAAMSLALVGPARAQTTAAAAPAANAATPGEITIIATEFSYAPASVWVVAGRPVTLVLDNSRAETEHGATSIFQFKAMNPGVYIYHCATPMIPYHLAHGMYGLMVVEPPGGWPKVDHEFYVMQSDIYLKGDPAESGMHEAAVDKMEEEHPDFVVFNGSVGSLAKERALKAKVGETVRIFFGNAGPNHVSSFHVIGEIFDKVHPEGAAETLSNVQSTLLPAGGATVVEFKTQVPGAYLLVDHSLGRLQKGALGFLEVEGPPNPAVFQSIKAGSVASGGH